MRLDWALLASAAEGLPNRVVYILGSGIDTLRRDQYPAAFGGAMVLRCGQRPDARCRRR